jgi:hypothetical protein
MAGSYFHVAHGWSLIENMGDAQEAVEQLMYLLHKAMSREQIEELLNNEYYPICRGEKEPDVAFQLVQEMMHR